VSAAEAYILCRVRRRFWLFGPDVREYLGVPEDGPYDDPGNPLDALDWLPTRAEAWPFLSYAEADRHLDVLRAAGEVYVAIEPYAGEERIAEPPPGEGE
jgi:hypothetical protein